MDPDAGSAVLYDKLSVPAGKLRTEHIGIWDIILARMAAFIGGMDKEVASFLFVEKGAEQETAVKPGKTHPFYVCPGVDISQVAAIANDTHVVLMNRHIFFLSD
jgi:hypothetical protein